MAAAVVVLVLRRHAMFKNVTISEEPFGPYEFVYRTTPRGDFGAVRRITSELEIELRRAGLRGMMPLQVFFPRGSNELEQIGFVVQREDVALASALTRETLQRRIPSQVYLTATMPYASPLSFLIGFLKVDPRLRAYRRMKGLKQTWAAAMHLGRTILYLQPKEFERPAPRGE